ncbi:uncharacterized protein LOC142354556 [Convolutriloba macropyga]|uniref:uncharacterized protein LOC142354556 n=1 Tax=Convolutriloba macropyga TaxID=536237 RepID=UPI003F522C4E
METAEESVYMNPIIVPDHENSTVTSAPDYINRIVGEQRRPIDEESARDYLRQQAAWNGNSSDLNRHLMVTSFVNQMQRNQSLEYVVPIFEEDFSNYQLPIMMENEYDQPVMVPGELASNVSPVESMPTGTHCHCTEDLFPVGGSLLVRNLYLVCTRRFLFVSIWYKS